MPPSGIPSWEHWNTQRTIHPNPHQTHLLPRPIIHRITMEVTPRHLPLLESQRFDKTKKDQLPLPLHRNHFLRQQHLLAPPPRSQPPSPHRGTRNFNESETGNNLHDSLGVLGLEVGATVMEVNIQYRTLARRVHRNKHNPNDTGLTEKGAVESFKLVNNVQQFLCTTLHN